MSPCLLGKRRLHFLIFQKFSEVAIKMIKIDRQNFVTNTNPFLEGIL
jgi:hypothetical protein